MTLAGRPIQRSGDAPLPPAQARKVELGHLLKGQYIQAQGGPLEISWNGKDWLLVPVGPPQLFLVSEPFVLVRATSGQARFSVLGVLV